MPSERSVRRLYQRCFGAPPAVVARAPGRVEVLGNHTDYNEGCVLSAAIDRAIWVAAGPNDADALELCSAELGRATASADPTAAAPEDLWARYPAGVYRAMQHAGHRVAPVCLAIDGDIPVGVGLSSSGALTVACSLALGALFESPAEPLELARICQRAEQEHVGTRCGLLDPLSSLGGVADHLLFLDFRSLEQRAVPWPSAEACLAITISGVSRSLAASAYNDRRADCAQAARLLGKLDPGVRALRDVSMPQLLAAEHALEPVVFRRARHVVGENERVMQAADLLTEGDLSGCGQLLWASHQSSQRDLENSCPELDTLVDIARALDGVYGSRLTGGGFGGATVTLLDRAQVQAFAQAITGAYQQNTGRTAEVCIVVPSAGAQLVEG